MLTPDFTQMTPEHEVEALIAVIKTNDIDILSIPSCNGIFREALNNDVLLAFEQQHNEAEPSTLDEATFSALLQEIVGEMSVSVQLGYPEILTTLKDDYHGEINDQWVATHAKLAYGITVIEVQAHHLARSISDDDHCSGCCSLVYVPGQESLCRIALQTSDWPCVWDEDDYSVSCERFVPIDDEEDNVLPDLD
jgi:hypothetical protein